MREMYPSSLVHYGLGAGAFKGSHDELLLLLQVGITDITFGSITLGKRDGNVAKTTTGTFWWPKKNQFMSNNAIGMQNEGVDVYLPVLERVYTQTQSAGMKLILSIAATGDVMRGNIVAELFTMCVKTRTLVDEWEINLGCPNIPGKPIQGYDAGLIEEILRAMKIFGKRFRLKLPNYNLWGDEFRKVFEVMNAKAEALGYHIELGESDFTRCTPNCIDEVCDVINAASSMVTAVVAVNTLPLVTVYNMKHEPPKPVLLYNNNAVQGGLGGTILATIALPQISFLRKHLDSEIDVIAMGCGATGQGITDALTAGANGVLFTTGFLTHGVEIFTDALVQYEDLSTAK